MQPETRGRILFVLPVLCAAAIAGACRRPAPPAPAQSSEPLVLYCGAGIREAAEPLIEAFRAATGTGVAVTYAGSGQLLAQIKAHLTGDLFMPGAALYVDRAVEEGLAAAESRRVVARFIPVLFVARGNPKGIASVADLSRPGLRVGLGDERACAVGQTTLDIFRKNGIDPAAVGKNVVVKTATVNDLGLRVKLGTVDAVILWDANARHFSADGTVIPIPPEQNVVSTVPVVRLKSARNPAHADAFIDFLVSPAARTILTSRGYAVDAEEGARP